MKYRLRTVGVLASLLLATSNAHAYTECTDNVSRVWIDANSGGLWVIMQSGLPWYLNGASNSNFKEVFASVTAALARRSSVTVRFAADGISCGSQPARADMTGMWQNAD